MTREEAAEILKAWSTDECPFALLMEAVDMAIKALEQGSDAIHNEREQAYMKGYEDASKRYRTEPCEDAISKEGNENNA